MKYQFNDPYVLLILIMFSHIYLCYFLQSYCLTNLIGEISHGVLTKVTIYYIYRFFYNFFIHNIIDWQVMCHTTLSLEPTHTGGQRLVIAFIVWYGSLLILFYFILYYLFVMFPFCLVTHLPFLQCKSS